MNKRSRRQIFNLCLSLLLTFAIYIVQRYQTKAPQISGLYRVTQVFDGDTIEVEIDGVLEKVRYIGMDTPETHRPNTPVQCYGPEASERNKQILKDNLVRLEADTNSSNRDRYQRLLRHIYTPEGVLVGQQMIQEGYAFAYTRFPQMHSKLYAEEEAKAKANKVGLWSFCNVDISKGQLHSN
jgi:micrococcal nuclease